MNRKFANYDNNLIDDDIVDDKSVEAENWLNQHGMLKYDKENKDFAWCIDDLAKNGAFTYEKIMEIKTDNKQKLRKSTSMVPHGTLLKNGQYIDVNTMIESEFKTYQIDANITKEIILAPNNKKNKKIVKPISDLTEENLLKFN